VSSNLPAYAIFFFGCVFIGVAVFYPWLGARFALDHMTPANRLLSFVLGLALLGLWSIWRSIAI